MLRSIGKFIWRFMVIFSFIVNIILVIVLLVLGLLIFDIKQNIADPLVGGLHTTAKGLENATIDWTIPVRDTIPVKLNIPLDTNTTVVLTEAVPLTGLQATIDLPGLNASNVSATVSLTLPAGLQLPVALDLDVPVDETLDVALDVRAVIPLSQTQLRDPIQTLGLLFEPLAIGLHNLPQDFSQAGQLVSRVLSGERLETLLLATDGSGFNPTPYNPWPGYSLTAGLNYPLLGEPMPPQNAAQTTGIVPLGGIPLLDSYVRPELYTNGDTPEIINARAIQNLNALGIPPSTYDGTMAQDYLAAQSANIASPPSSQATDTTTPQLGPDGLPLLDPALGGFEAPTVVPSVGGNEPSSANDLGLIMPTPANP